MNTPWDFVIAAYAVAGTALVVLVLAVAFNLRRWSKRAREEENS